MRLHYRAGVVEGSIAGLTSESSYGMTTWPRVKGRIISVDMGTSANGISGCPISRAASVANLLAASQHGIDPATYTFREYLLPSGFGSCSWLGLANVGCAPPVPNLSPPTLHLAYAFVTTHFVL